MDSAEKSNEMKDKAKAWECPKGMKSPGQFDPEVENIEIFLERFDNFVDETKMPKDKISRTLLESMSRQVYKQLHEARLTVRKDELEIRQQLRSLYGSRKTVTDYQQDYFDLKQQDGESIRAFAIRTNYLLHKGQLNLD